MKLQKKKVQNAGVTLKKSESPEQSTKPQWENVRNNQLQNKHGHEITCLILEMSDSHSVANFTQLGERLVCQKCCC